MAERMTDFTLIKQADMVMSRCGGRVLPSGLVAVDFPGGLVYNVNNPAGQPQTGYADNPEDTTFYVRSISISQDLSTYGRVQWPDGKYMSNGPLSLAGVAWTGPFKRVLTREIPIEPGDAITILTNPIPTQGTGTATNVSVVFGGLWRYLLTGGRYAAIPKGDGARYLRSPNGNILAPEMDLDTAFAEIPDGVARTPFTLQSASTQAQTIASPGGTATVEIPVSSEYDFLARRFEFETSFDGGVTGDVLVKFRDGSGYSFHTDFAPIGQVKDAPYVKNWCIKGGVSIFCDFLLRNATGVGNLNITSVQIVGARQKGGN